MEQRQTRKPSDVFWDAIDGILDAMEAILPIYLWFIAALALLGVATFLCIATVLIESI